MPSGVYERTEKHRKALEVPRPGAGIYFRTESTRASMRLNRLGKKHTDEWRKNAKGRFAGEKNPFYGKKHPKEIMDRIIKANTGKHREDTLIWKGNNAGYIAKHSWVYRWHGKANKCDNRETGVLSFKCSGKSTYYHWANKSDDYQRDVDDYYQLCVSCHKIYDTKIKK